ncbi:autotransporter domain-containing protein [Amorphus sp. 3PC139-8]|uniref:autotransporter domain-containing protein n=1 Tax=Amorphus sp. 3PC139-8 TaxID=2735676 RepID=UPI00345D63E2
MISFGDSLSDVGNTYIATLAGQVFPNFGPGVMPAPDVYSVQPPLYGRFTNQQVWLEYLAPRMGVDFHRLDDRAWAGAESTPLGFPFSTFAQTVEYVVESRKQDLSTNLYTFWIGGNDYANAAYAHQDPVAKVPQVVENIDRTVRILSDAGAESIIVLDVPDTSLTPLMNRDRPDYLEELHQASLAHNLGLSSAIDELNAERAAEGRKPVVVVKAGAFFQDAVMNPESYGLTNVTTPCFWQGEEGAEGGQYTSANVKNSGSCGPIDLRQSIRYAEGTKTHLFWDGFHPTATGHQLIAEFTQTSYDLLFGNPVTLGHRFVANVNTSDTVYAGTIGGVGEMVKLGPKMLTLGGTNSYRGGTEIYDGTLQISRDENLGAAGTPITFNSGTLKIASAMKTDRPVVLLEADPAKNYAFGSGFTGGGTIETDAPAVLSGVISGAGGLTKAGFASLTLAAANTYAGGTTVNEGELAVDGSIEGLVTVEANGILSGSGVINGTVSNVGFLAPGASVGTLTINGDYVQGDDGAILLDVDTDAADLLVVNGTAELDGDIDVVIELGDKIVDQDFAFFTASSGMEGAFDDVLDQSPFLQGTLSYQGNQAIVSFHRDFAAPAETTNQNAVAAYLNGAYQLTDQGDLDAVFQALDSTGTDANGRYALDSLSGQSIGDLTTSSMLQRRTLTRAVETRLAHRRSGVAEIGSAPSAAVLDHASGTSDPAVVSQQLAQFNANGGQVGDGLATWAQAINGLTDISADGNGLGFDQSLAGALIGIDKGFAGGLTGGFSLAYLNSNLDPNTIGGNAKGDSYQMTLYGSAEFGNAFVDALAGYAYTDWETTRNLDFGGLSRTATGSPDGQDLTLAGQVGTRLAVAGLALEPTAGLDWYHLYRSGFTETGAGAADLIVGSSSTDYLQSSLGVRVSAAFTTLDGLNVVPEARAAWYHDFLDDDPQVSAALAGFGGAGFTVASASPGSDTAVLGLGLNAFKGDRFRVYADYDLSLADNETGHLFSAGLTYTW